MDTTRKISSEALLLLDGFQSQMKRRGVKISQKAIIGESIEFALKQGERFVQYLTKKDDNTKKMIEKFLKNAKKFDFGDNWLEEIDTTT